jgi:hypothetical protein
MTMLESQVRDTPAEIRRRLFNPPGGHVSTELDIVAKPVAKRMNFDNSASIRAREVHERELLKKARLRRAAELAKEYQIRLAEWVLSAETEPSPPEIPKILFEQILIAVSKFYVIPRNQILSHRKPAKVVRPRQVAMYLAREMTELSFPQIGQRLGGKDHTTCFYGAQKIAEMLAAGDIKLAGEIAIIRKSMEVTCEPCVDSMTIRPTS